MPEGRHERASVQAASDTHGGRDDCEYMRPGRGVVLSFRKSERTKEKPLRSFYREYT